MQLHSPCHKRVFLGASFIMAALTLAPALGWAEAPAAGPSKAEQQEPSTKPTPRMGKNDKPNPGWMKHHDALVKQAKAGNVELYFEGDSITDFWTGQHPRGVHPGIEVWNKAFAGWHPGDFGISGDETQHVLWRLDNGELDGVKPKAIVLMIGTNNTGHGYEPAETAAGVKAIVEKLKEKEPQAKILLLAIFPRNASPMDPLRLKNDQVNKMIASLDDGKQVKFLNINDKFLQPDGTLTRKIMPDLLHPSPEGYQIWADAITPTLTEWLGKPGDSQPAK